jgi:membrane-associated phospholipid phosphatase
MLGTQYLTDFGDQAIVLPLAVGVAIIFVLSGWWRGALGWTTSVGTVLGLVLLFKLDFAACAALVSKARLGNPSGHTAGAAAVYGGLAGIAARSVWESKAWSLLVTILTALVVSAVFGTSRLELSLHSTSEVVIGGAIGVSGAVCAVVLAGAPTAAVRMSRPLLLAGIVLVLLHGFHLPAEEAIAMAAVHLSTFSICH